MCDYKKALKFVQLIHEPKKEPLCCFWIVPNVLSIKVVYFFLVFNPERQKLYKSKVQSEDTLAESDCLNIVWGECRNGVKTGARGEWIG